MDRLIFTRNTPPRQPEQNFLSGNPDSIIFSIAKEQYEIAGEQDKMNVDKFSAEVNFGSTNSGPTNQAANDQGFDFVGRAGNIDVKMKNSGKNAAIAKLFIGNSQAMAHSSAMSNAITTAAYGVPVAIIGITV